MTPPKGTNKIPITDPKVMEFNEPSDRRIQNNPLKEVQ